MPARRGLPGPGDRRIYSADVDQAVNILGANKFRNAGQVCVAPTRFLVHEKVYSEFVEKFTAYAKNLKVGNGLDKDTRMGPLVAERRLHAIDGFVSDAIGKGAKVQTGGQRKGNKGYFYEPTKEILEQVHERLAKGGIFVLDEYNDEKYPGETLALKEVLARGIEAELTITGSGPALEKIKEQAQIVMNALENMLPPNKRAIHESMN